MDRSSVRAGARSRDGQVLVIVAAGMFVLIAMVGLIIDGGNALGQQRRAQNAAYGIAMSGTAVIQDYLSGTGTTPTAGDVGCAVETAADAHDIDLEKAEFTNYQGTVIGLVPACGSAAVIPAGSQGVKGSSTEDFETFLMRAVGFGTMTTKANATAVVGTPSGVCPASAGCGVLPVTFPRTIDTCDGRTPGSSGRTSGRSWTWMTQPRCWMAAIWPSSRSARRLPAQPAGWTSAVATSPITSRTRAASTSTSPHGSTPVRATRTAARTS